MAESLNPKIDMVFKRIFGVDENKDLLISLINATVSEEDKVSQVTIKNPYTLKRFKKDKQSVLDIRAESASGRLYDIEIQVADEQDYDKRALFYWGKMYTDQIQSGEDYSLLNKAIGIHILNFTSIPGVEKYHNVFQMREVDSHIHYFKNVELHTIELNKFWKSPAREQEKELAVLLSKAKKSLDMWVAFLTRHDLLTQNVLKGSLGDPCLKKALHVLEHINFTKKERELYEDRLKWLRMEVSALKKVENDALERGREEGIGLVAQNLLKKNVDIAIIMESTGLTEDAINALRK